MTGTDETLPRSIAARVATVGLELPAAGAPAANYVPFTRVGSLVFLSGQICQRNGVLPYVGKIGGTLAIEDGIAAAELCALNLIAWIAKIVEDDAARVVQLVRLGGFVNCVPEFTQQPKVVNGASDLMVKIFGERGRHARTAVGTNVLPFDVAVEIDAIVEIQ
jgi:enamine deaminase RidA (YjgF/YER057c/UK114 family)